MSKVINKKTGIAAAVIGIVIIAAIVFSTTFSSAMTLDEAKEIAKKYVPQTAEFVTSEDEDNRFEVMFYDGKNKEKFEVEVMKETKEVKKVESQLDNDSGSKEVKLSEQDVEKIIKEKFDGVTSVKVSLAKDNGLNEYEASFKGKGFYGDADVHPVSGAILESTVKFGTAITIPVGEGGTSAEGKMLTREEAEAAAIKDAGGGVIKDVDIEKENGKVFYEIELVKDGIKYEYYIDASTGDVMLEKKHESFFDYDYDDDDYVDVNDSNSDGMTKNKEKTNTSGNISEAKAKEIVLAKVPGAKINYIHMEKDDGISVYEGKATLGNYEYEFEINASSGVIIEWDKDIIEKYDDDDDDDDDDEWDD